MDTRSTDVPSPPNERPASTAAPITVSYDGSRRSVHAVNWAADRAARTGDRLRVVSCYGARDLSELWRGPQPGPVSIEDATALIESARERLRQRWPALVPTMELSATPAHLQLVETSATSSLLVLGAPSLRRIDRWRVHPVARTVARRARCPVVLVGGAEEAPAKRRVLCGIDGSRASAAALRWASDEADARDAELQIAHVWGHLYPIEFGPARAHGIARVDHARMLNAAAEWARDRQHGPVTDRLIEGYKRSELLWLADEADLMVLGIARRGRWHAFTSSAYALSIRSLCPTVIVPEPPPDLP